MTRGLKTPYTLAVWGSDSPLTSNYLRVSIVEVWGSFSSIEGEFVLMQGDPASGGTVFDLAAQLGIVDLEKFLRACIANAAMMAGEGDSVQGKSKIKYTVEEAADLIGVSSRWLADECRAERVEHVHLARHRFFTHDQILRMLEIHVVKPFPDRAIEPHVARVMRRIQKDRP